MSPTSYWFLSKHSKQGELIDLSNPESHNDMYIPYTYSQHNSIFYCIAISGNLTPTLYNVYIIVDEERNLP